MVSKKVALFAFVCLVSVAPAGAEEAKIIGLSGRVTIDGKPAKVGDVVPAGARVETAAGGTATLMVGEDNVMKLSAECALTLEPSGRQKQLNVALEKGRVEGVRRVEEGAPSGATKVATGSGTMEISGGRYLIEKPVQAGKETVFLAVDGGAQLVSNSQASMGGGLIPLGRGEMVSLRPGSVTSDNKQLMVVGERVALSTDQASQVRTAVPQEAGRQLASIPAAPVSEPSSFRDTLPPRPSPIDQDPTQPIVPRSPRVNVKFHY